MSGHSQLPVAGLNARPGSQGIPLAVNWEHVSGGGRRWVIGSREPAKKKLGITKRDGVQLSLMMSCIPAGLILKFVHLPAVL